MAVSIAARGALGIRKEASFASGGGIDNWQVIESQSIRQSKIYIYQDKIRNSPEQINGQYSHEVVSGSIVFPITPTNPTQWWECGIGGSTSPYHPQIPLSSLAIEIQEGQIGTVQTSGDMIGRMEFSSKKGDVLRCSVDIEGVGLSNLPTASTASFPSGDGPYLHSECTFTLDGIANQNVESFTVAKENNLITDLYGNTPRRREIPATKAQVTGTLSILFSDTTMRTRFMNQLPSRITALYQRGSKSFQLDLVNVNYDVSERPMESQTSFILETLNFTAYVNDPTVQNSLKLTVVTT